MSQHPCDPNALTQAVQLYEKLLQISGKYTLVGHQDDTVCARSKQVLGGGDNSSGGNGSSSDSSNRSSDTANSSNTYDSDVYASTSAYPAVWGFDLGRIELGWEANIDAVPFNKIREQIIRGNRLGAIITFSWHSVNPITLKGYGENMAPKTVAAVLPGGAQHSRYLEWLGRVAAFLRSLKDDQGELIPVIFRPFHEHTGDWFWWCPGVATRATDNTEEEFVTLWRMTIDYLREHEQIHHLLIAYSPDRSRIDLTDETGGVRDYLYGYPGDDYVDVLGLDDYWDISRDPAEATPEECHENLVRSLTLVGKLAEERGKIAVLTEVGSPGEFAAASSQYAGKPWSGYLLSALQSNEYSKRMAWLLPWRNSVDGANSGAYGLPEPEHPYVVDFQQFIADSHIHMLR